LKAILEKSGFSVEPHPGYQGTTLFARKVGVPQPDRVIRMPENYERLVRLMSKEVATEHYRKKKPVRRFLDKCRRYPREFVEAIWLWNPRRIVQRELAAYGKLNGG
jgi:hypothetical protein